MREAHKECKYTWGKEKYGFDKNAELIIYNSNFPHLLV